MEQQRKPLSLGGLAALEARVLPRLPVELVGKDRPMRRMYIRSLSRRIDYATPRRRGAGRPRVPRQQRHVARSTSSSDPPLADDPDLEPSRRGSGTARPRHIGAVLAGS
jgi:hypothetical protein